MYIQEYKFCLSSYPSITHNYIVVLVNKHETAIVYIIIDSSPLNYRCFQMDGREITLAPDYTTLYNTLLKDYPCHHTASVSPGSCP